MRLCISVPRREIVRADRTNIAAASAGVDTAVEEGPDVILKGVRGGEALYSIVRVSVGSKLPFKPQSVRAARISLPLARIDPWSSRGCGSVTAPRLICVQSIIVCVPFFACSQGSLGSRQSRKGASLLTNFKMAPHQGSSSFHHIGCLLLLLL